MKKLYDQLFADGDFTGTFEDFKKQYGDANKSKALFNALEESGDYTQDFESFNSQFGFKPVKTEAVATETAPVTAVNEAVDTDLASEDISLEQFDVMEVAEKKKLSYKDRQRLLSERHRRDKGGIDSFDVSSNDYSKITDEEKIKLQEEASKQLLKEC